jgi:hypothetical protein
MAPTQFRLLLDGAEVQLPFTTIQITILASLFAVFVSYGSSVFASERLGIQLSLDYNSVRREARVTAQNRSDQYVCIEPDYWGPGVLGASVGRRSIPNRALVGRPVGCTQIRPGETLNLVAPIAIFFPAMPQTGRVRFCYRVRYTYTLQNASPFERRTGTVHNVRECNAFQL